MTKGLVIIDVQNDYFKDGNMELVGMEQAAKNCQLLLKEFRVKKLPVFHVQHLAMQEEATFFIPYTKGCEIHESVKPEENETLTIKNYPSSFQGTSLNESLKKAEVTELVVCGAMTHMCIDTTVRAAFARGYFCKVIYDACATRDLEFRKKIINSSDIHASFMAALQFPFATVLSTQEYLTIG